MATEDFKFTNRKTRISRRRADDVTIVAVIAEDLQDLFEKWRDAKEAYLNANDVFQKKNTPETFKMVWLACINQEAVLNSFWVETRDRYNIWTIDTYTIRDGYELVKAKPHQHQIIELMGGGDA